MSVSKNPFKIILLPKNRKTLIGVLFLVVVAGAVLSFSINKVFVSNGLAGGAATYNGTQVQKGSQASGTGSESAEYQQYVDEYNTTTIQDDRKVNPSSHPIPAFKNTPEVEVVVVAPATIPTLPVTAVEPPPATELCKPTDQGCIETRAELSGCLEADTQCLRDNFIIAMEACSITDGACVSSTYGSGKSAQACNANDMACILTQANRFQCSLADTQCLVARNIITSNECAPSDPLCQRQDQEPSTAPSNGLVGYADNKNKSNEQISALPDSSLPSSPDYSDQRTQPDPAVTKYDQAYMAQALNFVANKSASRKPVAISIIVDNGAKDDRPETQQSIAPQNTLNENQPPPVNTPKDMVLIKAGAQLFAVSDLALSSDYLGPVSLSILEAGPLYRAKLLGSMVHLEDKMRLELTRIVLESGEDFSINAVALDLKTTYAAVASQVDHHYLSRFGWWGFGTVLSAVGNATQLVAQQVQRNTDGSVTETISLSAQQQARIALGEIGAEIGSLMRDRMNQPATVHIDLHEELGVFFLDTVKRGQ